MTLNLRRFDQYTQTTLLPGMSAEMKTYYDMTLLDNAEPELVHDQFADKRNIPTNGGKTIEFRKYSALPKRLTALTEGVTPAGSALNVEAITATVAQFGDWIQLSDVLQLTSIDDNLQQSVELLGQAAGRTSDSITRDVLAASTYMDWAGYTDASGVYHPVTTRADITRNCVLTPDMVFKAAAELKAQNAKPVDGRNYVCIIHPYQAYDIMRSDEWIEASKYATPDQIYEGEIGKLGGVRFVQTTEAKIIAPENIVGMSFNRSTVQANVSSATTVLLTTAISAEDAAAATAAIAAGNNKVYINGTQHTVASVTAGAVGTAKLTLSASASFTAGAMVCGLGAGKDGSAVFNALFVGKNAYATTNIDGGGLETIIKQLGYGDDPLNQRASAGYKLMKTAKILCQEYMYRFETGSAFSATAQSN